MARDGARMASLFKEGCDLGDAQGCSRLGGLYEKGETVERDLAKAKTLLGKACEGGLVGDCYTLGKLLERGDSATVKKDDAGAVVLYRKSVRRRRRPRLLRSRPARPDRQLGVPKDLTQATALFRKACDGGVTPACDKVRRR